MILLALALLLSADQPAAAVDPARLKADVRALSADAFEGRGPGEPGEEKTIAYLTRAFRRAGLAPGGENGGWTQAVPLVRLDRRPGARLEVTVGGRQTALALGSNASLSVREAGRTDLEGLPIVFAGYGVVDRARGWDAYRGIDMRGKVALVLANDPDFEAGRDLGFEGRRMAYAGRTSAKFEAAARAGAAGVLIMHEEAAASYPFSQLASGDALPSFVFDPPQASSLKFTGWLAESAWRPLLAPLGGDLKALKAKAREPRFAAVALAGERASVAAEVAARPFVSRNVIGVLKGRARPDETVLLGAHWDANGRNGPDAKGDDIRNGAVDNAIGTAELLEAARVMAGGRRPERSVVFAAWTSEEKGLLGSEWYAAHPLRPLETTAAAINLDPHLALGAARDLELIGGGRTDLETALGRAAAAEGLRVEDEPIPEAGWYFRSDHYSFARRGVPALAFRAGRDLVEGGLAAGSAIVARYNARCYHQPCDEFDPAWTLAGAAQETRAAVRVAEEIANAADWPRWRPGGEFESLRAASEARRPAPTEPPHAP